MAEKRWDIIIIGSGPSGYTAAIYAARARLETLLISGLEVGGQLMYTTEVENFPGLVSGTVGPKLMMVMREQAQRFGTTMVDGVVTKLEKEATGFIVTVGEKTYHAQAVIVATGGARPPVASSCQKKTVFLAVV